MQDFILLATFAAASAVLVATPGPDMLLIASRSVSQGRLAGFACLAGVQTGTYLHAIAAAVGISQLIATAPMAYEAIRYMGIAYLLYMAWGALQSQPDGDQAAPISQPMPLRKVFAQGLLTNVLNPKMIFFVLAFFPQFIQPERGAIVWQMLLLATIINAVGVLINGAVIVFAARLRGRLSNSSNSRLWPKYLLATVFGGLALRLALDDRR